MSVGRGGERGGFGSLNCRFGPVAELGGNGVDIERGGAGEEIGKMMEPARVPSNLE